MSLPTQFTAALQQLPLIAILRGITPAQAPAIADHVSDQAIQTAGILNLVFDATGQRDLRAGHVGGNGMAIGKYFIARKQIKLVPYRFQRPHLFRQLIVRARRLWRPGALAKTQPPKPGRKTLP